MSLNERLQTKLAEVASMIDWNLAIVSTAVTVAARGAPRCVLQVDTVCGLRFEIPIEADDDDLADFVGIVH